MSLFAAALRRADRSPPTLRLLRPQDGFQLKFYTCDEPEMLCVYSLGKQCIYAPEAPWRPHRHRGLCSGLVVGRQEGNRWSATGQTPRFLSSSSAASEGESHRTFARQEASHLLHRGPTWYTEGRKRLAYRLRSLHREDWILFFISLGWGGVFGGAFAFNAWRSATRESRHPYLQEAKSMLQSDAAVAEYLGSPLEVKAVEEHTETFAPWKRLVLQLRGPKRCTQGFVCARRVGYSEEDIVEKFAEEDEGAWWSRPYVLKQWLLQAVNDGLELLQLLVASTSTENRGREEGVGQWEVTSLFLLAPQDTAEDDVDTQGKTPRVIVCKGSPADNPDWYRLLPPEQTTEKLFSHWVANTCLLLLCLYALRRVRAEWKMAAERLSSLRFVNHFITHHRHLQQLTARQLQDALKTRGTPPGGVSNKDERVRVPQVRLQYFTGQLSREAIDGVAHLEIQTQEGGGGDPDFADMLQSTLSLIKEPRDGADPPFPVVQTFALDPKALAVPAEA
ncbi:hypothetical protein, conserved [Eimeria brunetti]|uniref:Uncharacterized protein n=1 Tax=Eimeria brunetti TaxID=51314 RepID=U6LDY1_9EIME|nr:hypothetical protein, conserved [Eimeria brunetti]